MFYFDRHENVDLVMIRENTEGEYSHLEHEVKFQFYNPGQKSLDPTSTIFEIRDTPYFARGQKG